MRGPFPPHLCKAPIPLRSLFEGSTPFFPFSYLATATQSPAGRGIALPAPMGSGTCGGNGSWFRREHSGQAPPPRPGVVGSPPPTRVGPAWAAREGRTGRTRISASSLVPFPAFSWPHEGDSAWPHHLKHPPPKFLDWGEGWQGRGQRGLSLQPSFGTFSGFLVGKGALTGFEKGGGGEMNFYLSLPFFSPSFSAFHTPPPPILVEMRRGKRPQLSWKLPTLPYFRDQWEREQKGGGGTGQCIRVTKKRRQGCAPTGLGLLAPNPFFS